MESFSMGTVTALGDGTLRVRPDDAADTLQKPCLVPKGLALEAGDRVLLLKYAGCRLVLGCYGKSGA